MVAPSAEWRHARLPQNLADVDELFDERPARWEEARELISSSLAILGEMRSRILSESADGRASGSYASLMQLVSLLRRERIKTPAISTFVRSPFTESKGWGRLVPPAFFRQNVEREGFEASLRAALTSDIVWERRESAHALCHLGLPAESLIEGLVVAQEDVDGEVRHFANAAFRALASAMQPKPDAACEYWPNVPVLSRAKFTERTMEAIAEKAATTIVDFASPDVSTRTRAFDRASMLFGVFPGFIENLVKFLGSDQSGRARAAAASSLASAPVSERVVAALTAATRDRDLDVRSAAARSLGRMGAPVGSTVGALLDLMMAQVKALTQRLQLSRHARRSEGSDSPQFPDYSRRRSAPME